MEFDSTFNATCKLVMQSGRNIRLINFVQFLTHSGQLAGAPTKKMNDGRIDRAIKNSRNLLCSIGKPFLISPERKNYRRFPGDMKDSIEYMQKEFPELSYIPEWLPEVECIGVFNSDSPAHDKSKDCSSLTIIWYQDDFGIDSKAMELIVEVDWDLYASDYDI